MEWLGVAVAENEECSSNKGEGWPGAILLTLPNEINNMFGHVGKNRSLKKNSHEAVE